MQHKKHGQLQRRKPHVAAARWCGRCIRRTCRGRRPLPCGVQPRPANANESSSHISVSPGATHMHTSEAYSTGWRCGMMGACAAVASMKHRLPHHTGVAAAQPCLWCGMRSGAAVLFASSEGELANETPVRRTVRSARSCSAMFNAGRRLAVFQYHTV